jgi:hypothetical protein
MLPNIAVRSESMEDALTKRPPYEHVEFVLKDSKGSLSVWRRLAPKILQAGMPLVSPLTSVSRSSSLFRKLPSRFLPTEEAPLT